MYAVFLSIFVDFLSYTGVAVICNSYFMADNCTGFIRGILRGVRYAKSLRVLFLHRRSPSWTTLVLYSRAVFIFNEPATAIKKNPRNTVYTLLFADFFIHIDRGKLMKFLYTRYHADTGKDSVNSTQKFLIF